MEIFPDLDQQLLNNRGKNPKNVVFTKYFHIKVFINSVMIMKFRTASKVLKLGVKLPMGINIE